MSIGSRTALSGRPAEPRKTHGPVDPRLLRYARAARGYLVVTVALGLAGTALILAQAGLLAHALATAARGEVAGALAGTLIALLIVVLMRAAVSYGGEVTALRAAATVKSQLRSALTARALRRELAGSADQFPQDVQELQSYFEAPPGQATRAIPGAGLSVPIWLLGSSLFSAQLAG